MLIITECHGQSKTGTNLECVGYLIGLNECLGKKRGAWQTRDGGYEQSTALPTLLKSFLMVYPFPILFNNKPQNKVLSISAYSSFFLHRFLSPCFPFLFYISFPFSFYNFLLSYCVLSSFYLSVIAQLRSQSCISSRPLSCLYFSYLTPLNKYLILLLLLLSILPYISEILVFWF